MRTMLVVAVVLGAACGGGLADDRRGLEVEPVPDQVLYNDAVGPSFCWSVVNGGPIEVEFRAMIDASRLPTMTIKAGESGTECVGTTIPTTLLISVPAGAEGPFIVTVT